MLSSFLIPLYHVSVKFPKTSFLIMYPMDFINFNDLMLLLRKTFLGVAIFLETSSLPKCSVHLSSFCRNISLLLPISHFNFFCTYCSIRGLVLRKSWAHISMPPEFSFFFIYCLYFERCTNVGKWVHIFLTQKYWQKNLWTSWPHYFFF